MIFAVFAPGPMELTIILVVAVLLFGTRLPKVARSIGSSIVEFKKGINEVEDTVKDVNKAIRD